jgi:filamentous hemagglutinin family protein
MKTHSRSSWGWKLGLVSALAIDVASSGNCANAQITPDATLGAESSVVAPDVINGLPSDRIDGGAIRGTNLFHSFQEFNVDTGRGAYFSNPDAITNILSRVTGNDPSDILGTLGVLGDANLFLINPNGIIFGPFSSLDVGGSFMATTANAVQLGEMGLFSASEPTTSNLLNVNPSALFFNAVAAQAITNRSQAQSLIGETNIGGDPVGLQVSTGQTLALVGGNLVLEGGNLTTAEGRIELGSVAGPSVVSLNPTNKGWILRYEGVPTYGDIQLSGAAAVDASGAGGGDVHLQGRRVTLTDGSYIESSTLGAEPGGTLSVTASESVEAIGESAKFDSGLYASAYAGTTGTGGNLSIETGRLSVSDGAKVLAATSGEGDGGSLTVRASDSVEVVGTDASSSLSFLGTDVFSGARGNAGDLSIETRRLSVRDGGQVSASTSSAGNAGNLTVRASDLVELSGESPRGPNGENPFFPSGLFAQVNITRNGQQGAGKGGNITIETGRLSISDGSKVQVSTFGTGDAGDLLIRASEVNVFETARDNFFTTGIFAQVADPSPSYTGIAGDPERSATGDAGNLTIETERLSIRNGGQVSASTLSDGNAGSLILRARDSVEVVGTSASGRRSFLTVDVNQGARGTGGGLTIETGRLSVRDGARVSVGTFGEGDAGTLRVDATESVEVIGASPDGQLRSNLSAIVGLNAIGQGGDLSIETQQLSVVDGAGVSVSTFGEGDAGTLQIDATESVEVIGISPDGQLPSELSAAVDPEATGQGGDLRLITGQLNVRDRAQVAVSSEGTGDAGNLEVVANSIRLDNLASLSSNTTAGQGDIFLRSEDLVLRRGSNITTNATGTATGGNITLDTSVIAALENSDISANAQNASGGRVIVDASGIFGTQFRELENPATSDITASSNLGPQFSGTVEINTPDVELQNSLTQLAANFVSPDQVVAGSCLARRNVEQGSFTVTGTGGLPRTPYEAISGRYAVTGIQPIQRSGNVSNGATVVDTAPWKPGDPIQEAQGMIVTVDGRTVVGTTPQLVAVAKAQDLVCHFD